MRGNDKGFRKAPAPVVLIIHIYEKQVKSDRWISLISTRELSSMINLNYEQLR